MNAIVSDAMKHLEIGNAFCAQGRLGDAFAAYAKALALQPDLAEAHNCLGALYFSVGRMDDAVRSFRMALSSNPVFVDALQNLGVALHTQVLRN
jgi:protein O-GlcNAc transferase